MRVRLFFLTCAGAALAAAACGPASGAKPKEKNRMITAHQALEAACTSVKIERAGDITVEARSEEYLVTFSFVTAAERRKDYIIEITVDAHSGAVTNGVDRRELPALHGRSTGDGWEKYLSAKKAYNIALQALAGFSKYDAHGRLTIELWTDVYRVTFPIAPSDESLGPDFAMQVHVDASSGKVIKILRSS